MRLTPVILLFSGLFAISGAALAQTDDPFADGKDGAKVHTASGFVCPAMIGSFERDAADENDVQTGADICSYAALDGVYGTIVLVPLAGPYDAVNALSPAFVEQEGTGGKKIAEGAITLGFKAAPLTVYTRTYRTARAEALDYRIILSGGAVKNWAVQATVEYADPRDTALEQEFLSAVYADALKNITQ